MKMWPVWAVLILMTSGLTSIARAQARTPNTQAEAPLRIYFADVEGGQATLFVTPLGESLLVDTGYPGLNGRDANRIVALCKQAGINRIDNLLITHYHRDHAGGVPQLLARMPIGRIIDHGPNRETGDANTDKSWAAYQPVLAERKYTHVTAKVGDILPIKGMHVEIVSSDGNVLTKPLAAGGAGKPNPACASSPMKPVENTENDYSLGMMITFGSLRILDLGDLTWAKERPLMCPIDMLGKVDIYIVSHHGFERSGSPALVNAIAPRVAIMDNGPTKANDPSAWQIIQNSPRIAAGGGLWQLHTGQSSGARNVPDDRIANLPGPDDAAYPLQLTVRKDGTFAIFNQRTGKTAEYPSK